MRRSSLRIRYFETAIICYATSRFGLRPSHNLCKPSTIKRKPAQPENNVNYATRIDLNKYASLSLYGLEGSWLATRLSLSITYKFQRYFCLKHDHATHFPCDYTDWATVLARLNCKSYELLNTNHTDLSN